MTTFPSKTYVSNGYRTLSGTIIGIRRDNCNYRLRFEVKDASNMEKSGTIVFSLDDLLFGGLEKEILRRITTEKDDNDLWHHIHRWWFGNREENILEILRSIHKLT